MPSPTRPDDAKPTCCLITLGCPKNLVDSEILLARLGQAGYIIGAPVEEADIIVINTCAFLASAREESEEVIKEAVELKRKGHASRIIVAGCLPNRDGDELFDRFDEIDAIIGTTERERIVEAASGGKKAMLPGPGSFKSALDDLGRMRLTPRHTAYLRIAEGCDRKCTFCTIPQIRGPFRSKPAETVLAEAHELVADGAVELNVIAQETTAYGEDTGENLPALLKRLNRCGAKWLRLLYTHPRNFSDELIETMAECENVIPYVDIPLQHVSSPVLKRMGRDHDREHIEGILEKLRNRMPGIMIRTTFIAGFPGETEKNFTELLDFVKESRFDSLGVFVFSPEDNTPAARLDGQLPLETREERAAKIMEAQQEIAFMKADAMAGRELEVLVDGIDTEGRRIGRWLGQAPEVDSVCILSGEACTGSFVKGIVGSSKGYDLLVDTI